MGQKAQDPIEAYLRHLGRGRREGKALTDEAREKEWQAVEARREPMRNELEDEVRSFFQEQEDALLDALEAQKLTLGEVFNPENWIEALRDTLSEASLDALREGFRTGLQRIDNEDLNQDFDADSPTVQRRLRTLIGRVAEGINDTTARQLREEITEGTDNNESISEITDRVKDVMDTAKSSRARMIAQTTVTGSFESGQLEAFEQAGIEMKEWLSQRDVRVRESHEQADRDTVNDPIPISQPFEVGGALLDHPGDPDGPRDEVIRCRCTMVPVVDTDNDIDAD